MTRPVMCKRCIVRHVHWNGLCRKCRNDYTAGPTVRQLAEAKRERKRLGEIAALERLHELEAPARREVFADGKWFEVTWDGRLR